jgi:hypothetical protein
VQAEGDAVEAIDVSAREFSPHPFQEVARVDQEGVGGQPAAVPAGNVAYADDRPCAFHRISVVGLTLCSVLSPGFLPRSFPVILRAFGLTRFASERLKAQ